MIEENPQHFLRPVEEIPKWSSDSKRSKKATKGSGPELKAMEPVIGSHGWLKIAQTGIVIGRGLHRGRTVADLRQTDSNYLDWLSSAAGPLESGALDALRSEMND